MSDPQVSVAETESQRAARKKKQMVLGSNPPPKSDLVFELSPHSDSECILDLWNLSNKYVAFKVKTTDPNRYLVFPPQAVLDIRSSVEVRIIMKDVNVNDMLSQSAETGRPVTSSEDRFMVQCRTISHSDFNRMVGEKNDMDSTFAEIAKLFQAKYKKEFSKSLKYSVKFESDCWGTPVPALASSVGESWQDGETYNDNQAENDMYVALETADMAEQRPNGIVPSAGKESSTDTWKNSNPEEDGIGSSEARIQNSDTSQVNPKDGEVEGVMDKSEVTEHTTDPNNDSVDEVSPPATASTRVQSPKNGNLTEYPSAYQENNVASSSSLKTDVKTSPTQDIQNSRWNSLPAESKGISGSEAEFVKLREKYNGLVQFLIQLTAERDALQKMLNKANKDLTKFQKAAAETRANGLSNDEVGIDDTGLKTSGKESVVIQENKGFSLFMVVLVALAAFLVGRLLQLATTEV